MKRLLTLLLPLALVPAGAGGFFDDFDGKDLGSHWEFANPKGGMIYSVHDSIVDVQSLVGFAPMEWVYARVPEFGDFDFRARVGWDSGPTRQELSVKLSTAPFEEGPAQMTYAQVAEDRAEVSAAIQGGPRATFEGPSSGFHEFRFVRVGEQYTAFFNGSRVLEGAGTRNRATMVVMFFRGPRDAEVNLFVDSISVVPEPGTFLALVGGAFIALKRRYRRTR